MPFALLRRPAVDDATTTTRLLVCPPALQRALPAWWPLWLVRLQRRLGPRGSVRTERRLADARDDFIGALAGVCGEASETLRVRVHWARSMRELWHLRAALFDVLCGSHGEALAGERMAPVNRHFPTRAPRSGFAGFDARPR